MVVDDSRLADFVKADAKDSNNNSGNNNSNGGNNNNNNNNGEESLLVKGIKSRQAEQEAARRPNNNNTNTMNSTMTSGDAKGGPGNAGNSDDGSIKPGGTGIRLERGALRNKSSELKS